MNPLQASDEPASPHGDCGLVRLRIDLAYDGTDFSGWARQPGRRTVEDTVATALAAVLRLPDLPALTVAGRTDAGVHAAGQVAHVDAPAGCADDQLLRRLAGVLPPDVVVHAAASAPPGFDARFSATGRTYRYRVSDGAPDPLRRRDTLTWRKRLDVEAMNTAAGHLIGTHDFAAYCRAREGATTIRTLRQLDVARTDVVTITAEADAFCHNQVRAMVGALLAVGGGRRPTPWPVEVLRAGVRDSGAAVAPPHGLTLVRVDYPPDDQLGARAESARAVRTPITG